MLDQDDHFGPAYVLNPAFDRDRLVLIGEYLMAATNRVGDSVNETPLAGKQSTRRWGRRCMMHAERCEAALELAARVDWLAVRIEGLRCTLTMGGVPFYFCSEDADGIPDRHSRPQGSELELRERQQTFVSINTIYRLGFRIDPSNEVVTAVRLFELADDGEQIDSVIVVARAARPDANQLPPPDLRLHDEFEQGERELGNDA